MIDLKNEVRIIGGKWRSRKLRFAPIHGLRPTPSRVRETLFNWLRNDTDGARCLDLFSGSGALGFEAASRGASEVVLVDTDPAVCAALRRSCRELSAAQIGVKQMDVLQFLSGEPEPFDLIFLDPPFRRDMIEPVCRLLVENRWLFNHSKIYLESERELHSLRWPEQWKVLKKVTVGEVACHLFESDAQAP